MRKLLALSVLITLLAPIPALATGPAEVDLAEVDFVLVCNDGYAVVEIGDHEITMAHIRLNGEDSTWEEVTVRQGATIIPVHGATEVDLWVELDGKEYDLNVTCGPLTTTTLPTSTTVTAPPTPTTTVVPVTTTTLPTSTTQPPGTTTSVPSSTTTSTPTSTTTSTSMVTTTSAPDQSTTSTTLIPELPFTGPGDAYPWIVLGAVFLIGFGAKLIYAVTEPDSVDPEPYNIISE